MCRNVLLILLLVLSKGLQAASQEVNASGVYYAANNKDDAKQGTKKAAQKKDAKKKQNAWQQQYDDNTNDYYDTKKAKSTEEWIGMVASNTFYGGLGLVKYLTGSVVSASIEEVGKGLVKTVLDPVEKMVQANFNIWFKKNFPPTEFQLAKRADKNGQRVRDLVFNERVGIKVLSYVDQLNLSARNGEPLPSLLLYGPPGTGKTEIAKRLANEGNFEVVMFSSTELKSSVYYRSKANDSLLHIFNYASRKREIGAFSRVFSRMTANNKSFNEKIIIFIDEGEDLLAAPVTTRSSRSDELQAFLIAMGTRSPNFTVVVTTNFIARVDKAAYQRFSYRIEVENPDKQTRLRTIASYINKYRKRYPNIKFDESMLGDEATLAEFYRVSEGLAGRELERVAQNIAVAANQTRDKVITKEILLAFTDSEKMDQTRLAEEVEKEKKRESDELKARYREQYIQNSNRKAKGSGGDGEDDDDE